MSFENQVEAIGEVAGQAFNEALDGGADPAAAFEAATEAAQGAAGDMGVPMEMFEPVMADATEQFETAMNDGMDPQAAFDSIDVGGPDMDPIGEAAHTAFEEAIEGGADPAAAFEAATEAARGAAEEMGIPMEEFEAAAGEMQQEFMDACEGGMDPMQAFDSLEPPGMEGGMGPMGPDGDMPPPGDMAHGDMPPGDMGGMFDDAPPPPPPEGDMPPPPPGMEGMDFDGDGQPPPPPPEGTCLLLGWIRLLIMQCLKLSMSIIMRLLRDRPQMVQLDLQMELLQWIRAQTCLLRMIHLRWRNKFSFISSSTPFWGRRPFLCFVMVFCLSVSGDIFS